METLRPKLYGAQALSQLFHGERDKLFVSFSLRERLFWRFWGRCLRCGSNSALESFVTVMHISGDLRLTV